MPVPCSEIVNDIEDLVASLDVEPKQRYSSRKNVKIRAKKRESREVLEAKICSDIPGTQYIYIKTWGCAHNSSDSEYMAGQLSAYGYKLTEDPLAADLWLLNSCTVKGPAEAHFRNEVERGQKLGKHIVTAGCVPQGAPKSDYLHGLSAIGVQNIDRVVEVVEETLKGHSVRLFGPKKASGKKLGGADLMMPKIRKNPLIEIIPINTGCLNQCTYCKTKHARGELGSYPVQDIVDRAVAAFSEGVVELWLTSEDTGAYGRDIGETLPGLLRELVKVIPPGCRMRLGMTNPPYILEHLEAMAEILNHPRVYKFLHVPVQSGSDQVLADMKRDYTADDFRHVANFLRERVPGITIATDIICGFPTETTRDFEMTLDLCREFRFPSLFINQFYPRPGTPAARMTKVPAQEVKLRTKVLSDFFQSYHPYEHQLGREMEVLVTEEARDGTNLVGHNEAYEQVLVPSSSGRMGSLLHVKIIKTKKHCLIAEVLSERNLKHRSPFSPTLATVWILVIALVLKIILLLL